MAFGFAKQSGGHLKIQSEIGQGTTINLYLPRATTGVGEAAPESVATAHLPQGSETVLLVDDNPAVRKTASRQLIDLGHRVVEAEDATGALAILAQGEKIDLLFSDIIMPGGLSGFDLAAKAEKLYPSLKVLLVTGFAEAAVKTRAAQNGANGGAEIQLLNKPYRRQELAQRIRELLDAP
jgi:CheY-like chemotaxis protein